MGEVFRALARRFFVLFLAAVVAFMLVLVAAGAGRADPTLASWYGPGFEGRTTSNGEKFDPKEYTAAHRKLPFGTKLLVTYGERSVVVRINDRGPFSEADLDLSRAAAKHLRMIRVGVAEVEMATVDPDTPVGPYKEDAEAPPKDPQEKDLEKKDPEKDRNEPEAASSREQEETRKEPEAAESQSPRDEEETRPDDQNGQEEPRDTTEAAPPASVESAPQDTPEQATPPATEENSGSADERATGDEESSEDRETAAADEAREDRGTDRRDDEVPAARSDDKSPADGDEERETSRQDENAANNDESSDDGDEARGSSRQNEDAAADDDEDRGDAEAPEGSQEAEEPEEADEGAPPPPQRIVVAPEPELVFPGSTVERRLELAAVAEEDQGAQLESPAFEKDSVPEKTTAAKSSGSSGKGPNGITRLPDTGGASVPGPALLLLGAALGLLLLRR